MFKYYNSAISQHHGQNRTQRHTWLKGISLKLRFLLRTIHLLKLILHATNRFLHFLHLFLQSLIFCLFFLQLKKKIIVKFKHFIIMQKRRKILLRKIILMFSVCVTCTCMAFYPITCAIPVVYPPPPNNGALNTLHCLCFIFIMSMLYLYYLPSLHC